MAYSVEWKVENTTRPDVTYDTVVDFWFASANDQSKVTQHLNNDSSFVLDKYSTLSADKKSVTHTKSFANEDSYNEWLTAKNKLPVIDEELTFTKL